MRLKLVNTKTIILNMVLAASMVLPPLVSYADTSSTGLNSGDDAVFSCASAINVMDCIQQTQSPSAQPAHPSNLSLNNQAVGLSGPINFNVRYDSDLSWIVDAGYAQNLGSKAAAALKISAGPNEYRGNGTLGFAITPKQQIKLTYEYLSQNLPFDYSSGTINQRVSQNAYGAAYRYMLGNSILQGIELSGSYTKANSMNLADVNMPDTDQIDQRRIAGGQQKNGLASVILTPFKNTIVKLGAGYSASSFDTQWDSNQANSTIAYNVETSHLVTPQTLVSASVNNTSTNMANTVKISRILPGHLEANITGQYNVSHVEGIASNANISAGLSYPAPKTYSNMFAGGIGDLKSWVEQPVIYNSRVLAIAEERLLSTKISTSPIKPREIPVGMTLQPTINTSDYFTFDPKTFDKITYTISSVILKSDPKTAIDPNFLMLTLVPTPGDNYSAVLQSGPMPAAALTTGNGQYTVTLTAQGYKKNQLVGTASDTVDIIVEVNQALKAPSWKTGVGLNGATTGKVYTSTDLLTLVTDNSQLPAPGDQYTFVVSDLPQPPNNWLTLDADGHTLKGTNVPVPQSASNPTKIKIYAHSIVSDKDITNSDGTPDATKVYDIAVSGTGNVPTWNNNVLPNPDYQGDYGKKNVNLSNNIANSGTATVAMKEFLCVSDNCPKLQSGQTRQALAVTGLTLDTVSGAITGTPSDSTQFQIPQQFTIRAWNSADISSDKDFTLTVQPNSQLPGPKWNSAQTSFQDGYVGNSYGGPNGSDLNNYFTASITGDSLSYQLISKGSCTAWLTLNAGDHFLTGKPTDETKDCGIQVKATSKMSGNSITTGNNGEPARGLAVLPPAPKWSTDTIPAQKYQDPNISINLSQYVSDTDPNDTFKFDFLDGALPSGFSLVNGAITGQSNKIGDIKQTFTFTISATSNNDKSLTPAKQTLTMAIEPNPGLTFAPTIKSLPGGTPGLPYSEDLKNDVQSNIANDYITNYTLGTNNCNSDKSWNPELNIQNTSVLQGTPKDDSSSCQFSLTVTSFASGNSKTFTNQPITITPDVSWTSKELWGGNTPVYMSGTSTENLTSDDSYVVSAAKKPITISSTQLIDNFITLNNNVITTDTTNFAYVSSSKTGCTDVAPSTIKLNAGSTVGGNPEPRTFNQVCLLPNSALNMPAVIKSVLVDSNGNGATYGQPFTTVSINPYDNAATPFVSKTSNGSMPVADDLSFSLSLDGQNPVDQVCGWLSLQTAGKSTIFTGTNVGKPNYCTFYLIIKSRATGKSQGYSMNISTAGAMPTWNSTSASPIGISGAVPLSINPGAVSSDHPLKVVINSKSNNYSWWRISQDTSGNYYLSLGSVNDNTVPASMLNTTSHVYVDLYNAATPSDYDPNGTPQEGHFIVTVNSTDKSLKIRWGGENPVQLVNDKDGHQTFYPGGTYLEYLLQTYFTTPDGKVIVVTGDQYVMNYGGGGGGCSVSGVVNQKGYQYSYVDGGNNVSYNASFYITTQNNPLANGVTGQDTFGLYGLGSKAQLGEFYNHDCNTPNTALKDKNNQPVTIRYVSN
jgi:hypothetical protein